MSTPVSLHGGLLSQAFSSTNKYCYYARGRAGVNMARPASVIGGPLVSLGPPGPPPTLRSPTCKPPGPCEGPEGVPVHREGGPGQGSSGVCASVSSAPRGDETRGTKVAVPGATRQRSAPAQPPPPSPSPRPPSPPPMPALSIMREAMAVTVLAEDAGIACGGCEW